MKYRKLSDIADDISREGVIVSPAATGSRSSNTPEVVSLTGVLGQIIKVFVIIHSENISLLTELRFSNIFFTCLLDHPSL